MPYFSSIERLGLPAGLGHSREAGWQEGWQQGRQEGFLEALKSMVLETVAIRFGSVPEDLIHTVNSITTRDTLRGLHRQAITVPNLDAFEEALWLAKGGG